MSERSLVLIKPDAVARGLVGTVLARYEAKGLTLRAMELRTIDAGLADQLGLDPATLADQLEQLHEQGNALADLLTQ